MFQPSKQEHHDLLKAHSKPIQELEQLLKGRGVNVYLDYANVRPWANRLGWHIDLRRLKDFLRSFDNVHDIKLYYGTLKGNLESQNDIQEWKRLGYIVRTKDVKIIKLPVDASSISPQSPDLLKNFIRAPLLRQYNLEAIEYLNKQFAEMNKRGIYFLEDRKCNFDVEIGRDMTLDRERNEADCFVLWSGDSDFHDPLNEILTSGRKAILFASARLVASELNELRVKGLIIFDIRKIREFICWKRELAYKSQRDIPEDAPKH